MTLKPTGAAAPQQTSRAPKRTPLQPAFLTAKPLLSGRLLSFRECDARPGFAPQAGRRAPLISPCATRRRGSVRVNPASFSSRQVWSWPEPQPWSWLQLPCRRPLWRAGAISAGRCSRQQPPPEPHARPSPLRLPLRPSSASGTSLPPWPEPLLTARFEPGFPRWTGAHPALCAEFSSPISNLR